MIQSAIEAINRIDSIPTILDVVCRTTGMGFAAVARVTEDRWVACQVLDKINFGLVPGGELRIATTLCNEIRQSLEPVIINHVAEDGHYRGHHTPAMYGFQSYISVPIIHQSGQFFGTLCAIDPRPARLNNPETISMFKLFAELIATHLDSDGKLQASSLALRQEQHFSELREQFIAVLGHDLRNPLAAVSGGVTLIGRTQLEAKAQRLLPMIQSSIERMSHLIDDVLDFARGRLGDGLSLTRAPCNLKPILSHVVAELHTTHPGRLIETDLALPEPVNCDPARLAQLLSNVLSNALTHGAPDQPVLVQASTTPAGFELSVTNHGDPIPASTLARLFDPFERGAVKPGQQGLGLGLYIAAQIAKAHAGTLTAASAEGITRFTFRIPQEKG